MNPEDLINTQELCTRYKVEQHFISSLSESGLLRVITIEEAQYLPCDEMAEFEKLRRLHYELEINLEGIEAIQHLLGQIRKLQKQNLQLKNRLDRYE